MLNKKKAFVLFLCCISALVVNTNTINAKTTYKYGKTTVNIRKKPTIKSKSIGTLDFGEKVTYMGKYKEWAKVKYKKKIAYIKSCYLLNSKPKYTTKKCPNNSFKSYMSWKCITSTSSKQYKLQKKAYTDSKTGIRMINGRYCIAVGSYYTKRIGVKIDLVMKNGKVVKCITADQKADCDTVNKHRQHPDGSVVEFIVDTNKLPRIVKLMGDVSYTKPFKSKIKAMRIYK